MSFSPPGESATELLFEKSILIGTILSAAAYGKLEQLQYHLRKPNID